MKRTLLFLALFTNIALILNLNAQTQPENPSFEDWEDVGLPIDEPVNWSSIKTSDNSTTNPLAPVVWGQSTDAHTGSYSFKLFNVETIGSIVAAGTATNGRVHADFNPNNGFVFTDVNDPRWNTPCTDRPDSLVAWVKYYPEQGDVGKIRALLHTGYGRLPDSTQTNWIGMAEMDIVGTIDNWTRLSANFEYFNNNTPEYLLINMYSGNGTTPVKDSWALIDDVELIYNQGSINAVQDNNIDIYSHEENIFINWHISGQVNNAQLIILDISGRAIWEGAIESNQLKSIHLDTPGGIYICKINAGSNVYSRKLFIP